MLAFYTLELYFQSIIHFITLQLLHVFSVYNK